MKKFLWILVFTVLISGAAFAGFNGQYDNNQGFKSSVNPVVSPIKDVLKMRDNQVATIKGNIVKRMSDDKYLFKDNSGEMTVEIDNKYWGGLQVDESNVLELTGKVDKDFNSISLEVFTVKKIK